MMKKMTVMITLLLTGLMLSACTHMGKPAATSSVLDRITKNNELVVGTAASMPPLNMTTKTGKVIGLEVDLARMMANAMDVDLRIETMPFAELLSALEAGKIDMILSGMTITPKRNLKAAFVGPYFVSGKALLTKAETMASIKDPAELSSSETSITALEGSTSQQFVERLLPKAKLTLAKDYDEAVDMVVQGEVDAMIADHPICLVSVARYPEHKLFTLVNPWTFEPIGIGLPANDALFLNWVENFLFTFKGSGGIKLLENRWLKKTYWLEELP